MKPLKYRPLRPIPEREIPTPPPLTYLIICVCIVALIGIGLTIYTVSHPAPAEQVGGQR